MDQLQADQHKALRQTARGFYCSKHSFLSSVACTCTPVALHVHRNASAGMHTFLARCNFACHTQNLRHCNNLRIRIPSRWQLDHLHDAARMSGTLPSRISLESLVVVDLRNNSFYGAMPSDASIPTLVRAACHAWPSAWLHALPNPFQCATPHTEREGRTSRKAIECIKDHLRKSSKSYSHDCTPEG